MRLLDAVSRTGTRKHLVENMLEAQEGRGGTLESGFDAMITRDEDS